MARQGKQLLNQKNCAYFHPSVARESSQNRFLVGEPGIDLGVSSDILRTALETEPIVTNFVP